MPSTIADFWKLLADSRLVTGEHCQQLQLEFSRSTQGSSANDPHTLGNWLIAGKILSAYQSTVLLNGHSGPFFYGDFRIQDRITSGRFSGYFQAVHQPTAHHVLLQFLTGDDYQDPTFWQELVSSVHRHSTATGSTLQEVHEILDVGDFRIVVYEDLGDGQTAKQFLATEGRLTADDACRLSWALLHAVYQLHQAGLVSGSICTENLWVAKSGHLYFIRDCTQRPTSSDYRRLDQDPQAQAMVDYCAPELAAGDQPCNALTDMYALGCTCYELLTGKPPFAGPHFTDKLQQHATQPIPPLEALGVPQAVSQLIAYLMAKNPQLRYQNWDDLKEKMATQVKPEHQHLPPVQPSTTLARYQSFAHQRQVTVAAKAAAPLITPAAIPPIQKQTDPTSKTVGSTSAANATDRAASPAENQPQTVAAKKSSTSLDTGKNKQNWWQSSAIIWVSSAIGALILTAIIVFNLPQGQKEVAKNKEQEKTGRTETGKESKNPGKVTKQPPTKDPQRSAKAGPTQTIVDDPQGDLLWASPTQGPPFKLSWVPPAGQLFMLLRPASLMASQEGERVLDALGPTFQDFRSQWEKESAVKLTDIDTLMMTLHNNDEQFPRPSFVVRLKASRTQNQLLAGWGNPSATKGEGETYYKGSKWSFFLPSNGEDKTFLMGVEEDVRDVAARPASMAPLRREIAELLKTTDSHRHFTVVYAPNFLSNNLFRDGRTLFFGDPGKLRRPLEWLIGKDVKAGLLSLHVEQHFYLEARLFGALGQDQFGMARELRNRMNEIPEKIEEYFVILNPPPYWRLIANRYPSMIRRLYKQTRIGVDQGHAMVNIAMQPEAAHNLLLGGELCLSSTPGATAVTTTKKTGPKSIDELLKHKFSVEILQQDLEFAIKDIVTDVRESIPMLPFEFDIKIIGPELKLEGITRNQAVRNFAAKEKSLSEILTGIVSKANPDPSVKDPSEPAQKLIWVVADDPEKAGRQIILITTRKDAEEEKYSVPKLFQLK